MFCKNNAFTGVFIIAVIIFSWFAVSSCFPAVRSATKMGNPAQPGPQSNNAFQYETRTKWNKGVNDLDSLFNGAINVLRADSIGIGIKVPAYPFHFQSDYLGIARARFENTNTGSNAVVGTLVEIVNDQGYWGATGITNSGSTILGGTLANSWQNYNQGYGDFLYTNDGNVDFRWFSDPADNHNFSALNNEIMTLTAAGSLVVAGEVDCDFITIDSAWDDLRFPFTQTKLGSLLKPDFDFNRVGLLFPNNEPGEKIYIIGQIPHDWDTGTGIEPHMHWLQETADFATWVFMYNVTDIGEVNDGTWDTLTVSTGELPYTSGNMHQLSDFGMIEMAGFKKSAIFTMKLWRDDATIAGDVLGYEFDIHYKRNKLGTRTEF